jgi:hypothetical protein
MSDLTERVTTSDDVLAERHRQVEAEGWTPEHDDKHSNGSIALASALYATNASLASRFVADGTIDADGIDDAVARCPPPSTWPWDRKWWKPKGRRRDLVRAAALILAEIERLDRATPSGGG